MLKYFFTFLLLSQVGYLTGQTGKITGVIVDGKTGETLPGATILIEGTTKGASADFDGKFTISNVPAGKVTLITSYVSYSTKKIESVNVIANDVVNINVSLDQSGSQELQEVEVVVKLNRENNTALVLQQKNNAAVSDGVSAETLKRTPDRTTSDALKRVSGVTIQDDKFVVIRGLNERYNASYLNGAPLPSTEPDKKAFAFDLFPSNMLDNIVINKTATPDMPSEFAGGIVQINTKSIPEQNFISFSAGAGYNTITTGREKIIYPGGKYDNLGFDDGSRDLPAEIPAYTEKASWIKNTDQAKMATYFKNDWAYSTSQFAPNSQFQLAGGYNLSRKEKDFLGIVFSLGYNNVQSFYNLNRIEYDGIGIKDVNRDHVIMERNYSSNIHQALVNSGALLNLSLKLNDNNSISLRNMFTGASDNKFVNSYGTNNVQEANRIINRVNTRYFTASQIYATQLIGKHLLPASKIMVGWNAAISKIQRDVPNMRVTSYSKYEDFLPFDPSEGPNMLDTAYRADISSSTGPSYAGYRVYNHLNENMKSVKADVSRLFKLSENVTIDPKAGFLYQTRARQFGMRSFGLQQYTAMSQGIFFDDKLLYLPEDQIFAESNMSVTPQGNGGFKLFENTKDDDNYSANSTLAAGYGMFELRYSEKFRAILGLRYESYTQNLVVAYPAFDSVYVNNTINDLLPSLNLVYNFTEKTALRFAYYKTLNRPEFRELAKVIWYDPETRLSVSGNPALTRSYIDNYDLRYEVYPGRGQIFTVSGFYKYFDKPIERYMLGGQENQIVYSNSNFAKVYGSELEYRVNLGAILKKDSVRFLNNLSLFANLSLMKSSVNVAGINSEVPDVRTMQGQSPYIINAGLSYVDLKDAFSISAIVNRVGERIYIVGNDQIANRWENARTVLDMQFTKGFLKNRLEVRFNIKDLLHPDYIVYYKGSSRTDNLYDATVDYTNFRRNYGSTYTFIVSYRF